jgi:hypothetical protein
MTVVPTNYSNMSLGTVGAAAVIGYGLGHYTGVHAEQGARAAGRGAYNVGVATIHGAGRAIEVGKNVVVRGASGAVKPFYQHPVCTSAIGGIFLGCFTYGFDSASLAKVIATAAVATLGTHHLRNGNGGLRNFAVTTGAAAFCGLVVTGDPRAAGAVVLGGLGGAAAPSLWDSRRGSTFNQSQAGSH